MNGVVYTHKPGDLLRQGQRITFRDFSPGESWLITHVSEAAATVERELRYPKLVEIKDDDGNVIRSFYAKTSGDRMQISSRSIVDLAEER